LNDEVLRKAAVLNWHSVFMGSLFGWGVVREMIFAQKLARESALSRPPERFILFVGLECDDASTHVPAACRP